MAFDCEVKFVNVPLAVEPLCEDEVASVGIEPWPILLPGDILQALVDAGHIDLLIGDRGDRDMYWNAMQRDFPCINLDPGTCAALAIYGDEATVFRESCMCLHMAPVHCPARTDSLLSRYLLAIIPSSKYWIAT